MAEDDDAESQSFLALGAERGPTVMLPTARVVSGLRWERSDRVLMGRNDVILSAENQFELHRRT